MKRFMIIMVTLFSMAMSTNAMSYEQARREALFLTDKMAYELNLNDMQYEAAYEINLDYLMGVTSVNDLYGTYWTRRNLDFGYILLNWQWNAFCAASYFYRPLYWNAGYWHFGIYARYPRRDYYYFSRPRVYVSYCGGHSWRHNGGHSYYKPRRNDFHRGSNNHVGMRDHWNNGNVNRNNGNRANSSTRITANGNIQNGSSNFGTSKTSGSFSGNRSNATVSGGTNNGSVSGSFGNRAGSTATNGRNTAPKSIGSTIRSNNGSFSASRSNTFSQSPTNTPRVTRTESTQKSLSRSGSFSNSATGSNFSRSASTPSRVSSSTPSRINNSFSRSSLPAKSSGYTPSRMSSNVLRSNGSSMTRSSSHSSGSSSKASGSFSGRR